MNGQGQKYEHRPFSLAIVIGAGAFGTSIASVLSHNFQKVIVKVRSQDVYESMLRGENSLYLPGKKLPSNIVPALDWEQVAEETGDLPVDLLVSGLPTSAIKEYCLNNYTPVIEYLRQGVPVVSLSKGMDPETLELPDDLFMHCFLEYREQFCFLSGPSFANEIIDEQITLVNIAGRSREVLVRVCKMFQTNFFRAFYTYDVKGLLLGGALKNVLAIAVGIVEGLGYNHNTRAALITIGILDMLRLGKIFNGLTETFYGLSGMGDLILTTTGDNSRNKMFGIEVGKGKKVEDILGHRRTVVEGHKTAKAVQRFTEKYEVRCPIFHGVYRVLYEGVSPQEEISKLMRLSAKMSGML